MNIYRLQLIKKFPAIYGTRAFIADSTPTNRCT